MTNNNTSNVRERTRDETSTHTDDTAITTCPECGGEIIQDDNERVCSECGLVFDEDQIDRGPEWRAFNHDEKQERSRVGAPTTESMHDKGLSTNISWQDKDGYGNPLSTTQRKKMQRLRKWNERFRTKDSSERNLKQAFGEIERMASSLGLSKTIRETASVIYRRAQEEGLIVGRSIESGATAALYAACREHDTPRTLDDFATVSRVEKREFNRTYRYIVRELELKIEPSDPRDFINQFLNELEISSSGNKKADIHQTAREMIDAAEDANLHSGRSPTSLAAAAIYAAGRFEGEGFTQREVADAADTTEVTIRNRYQEILKEYSKQSDSVPEIDSF